MEQLRLENIEKSETINGNLLYLNLIYIIFVDKFICTFILNFIVYFSCITDINMTRAMFCSRITSSSVGYGGHLPGDASGE